MKNYWMIFALASVVLLSCKTKKELMTNNNAVEKIESVTLEKEVASFSISPINTIAKEDLLFNIQDIQIANEQLAVQVQYGGGCVKPHVFELVTDGVIDQAGTMKFYLLHKTHDDKCKALLIENKVFDLSTIYNLKSDLLKSIQLNNLRKTDI